MKCCFIEKESSSLFAINRGWSSLCSSSYLLSSLSFCLYSGVCVFLFICDLVFVCIHKVHVSTQACLPSSPVHISVCSDTDGCGMHHPFCSLLLALHRPPQMALIIGHFERDIALSA